MRLRRKHKLAITALLFLMLIILIVLTIDKIRFNGFVKDYNEVYELEINGKKIEPSNVEGKSFIFNKIDYQIKEVSVPKNSTINLDKNYKLSDSKGKKIEGDITYLSDGNYILEITKKDYKYIYELKVDNDFSVELDTTNSQSAGYIYASFSDVNKGEDITIEPTFISSENFNYKANDTIIPIDYNNDPGTYTISFSSSKSSLATEVVLKEYYYREDRFDVAESVISDAGEEPDKDEAKAYEKANNRVSDFDYYKEDFKEPSVGYTTGDFGDIRYINGDTKPTKIHYGVDYANVLNTPIYSTATGEVSYVGFLPSYGNVIVVDHGNGVTSHYYHLDSTNVKVGDIVDSNTVIGQMGTTGYSTGVHLHFEVHVNGIKTNPYLWLN